MTIDVLLKNGRVIDGTGSPWFRGAIGISNGQVEEVSHNSDPEISADVEVDVKNDVIAPGFIDTHSHSDLKLFDDPSLAPKISQGITTEILGQDGFSMAPLHREEARNDWKTQLRALAGDVSVEWDWSSVADYFEAIREQGIAPNVGMHVGHGTARFNVLGMADRDPSDEELAEMKDIVNQGLEDGALGLSTGLIYTPAAYSSTGEVAALAESLSTYGRPFVAHIRSEGRWIWEALDEFIDIGAKYDIPLHLSHFKLAGTQQHGLASHAIKQLETARNRGVDIIAEQYPYESGSTMLSAILPPWVHAEGPEVMLAQLSDSEIRERIKQDIEDWRIEGWENFGGLAGWENVYVTSAPTSPEHEGSSIAELAAQNNESAIDVVCDLLVENELNVSMRIKILSEDDVQEIMSHELVTVGTDGLFGGEPHPRVYGTYPRILGNYIREKNILTLEEAVRKMTALPARAMGLKRKGILKSGMDADIVVFDPSTVASPATYDQPHQYPDGITHVLVNGVQVVTNGEVTQQLPGKVITA